MPNQTAKLPPAVATEVGDLDLEAALQLLRQAGYADRPQDAPGSLAWLQTVIDRLCEISLRDGLTGLANPRHFKAALEQEVNRVSRSGEIALLLLIDVDHFKQINDRYGHLAGDQALRTVAGVLAKQMRAMDTAARYGGDEFAVILREVSLKEAGALAQRFVDAVRALRVPHAKEPIRVSVSVGLAECVPGEGPAAWVERADAALYRAKSGGRDRWAL